MRRILRMYLYGSVHIAAMGWICYYFYHIHRENVVIESTIFGLSIFCYYNLNRILRVQNYESIQENDHLNWVSKNFTELLFAIGFSTLLIIMLSRQANLWNIFQPYIFVMGVVYLFLRHIPILKNGLIAFVWMSCTTYIEGDENSKIFQVIVFLYFFILSMIYDQKDLQKNKGKEIYYLFWIDGLLPIPYILYYFIIDK